ncbi:MAG: nitroreductase family protein [Actinomycetota bacterium]|nr:nitroreductase family protein [Actinomycetota bacterium]
MELEEAIRSRRTHKAYGPQPVDRGTLEELFEVARWAPSHHLAFPWRFRVLGPAALGRLKAADPEKAGKLDRAPTLVVASVVLEGDPVRDVEDRDAAAVAAYLVLLAAHGRGLAGYWRTPLVLRTAAGRAAVGLPDDEQTLGLLHLGAPRQEQRAPERPPVGAFARFLD